MFHSSGRWPFGSHWPKSSRKERMRSFARARSSSRRAPPKAARKPCCSIASSSVTDWSRLRLAREVEQDRAVLAAGEQEHGALQLSRDLADDVDGLRLEGAEM